MPSLITHAYAGVAAGAIYASGPMPPRFWALACVCGMLPDIDAVGYYLGVRYTSTFGHRGFTHSILFAAAAGIIVTELAFPGVPRWSAEWFSLAGFFFAATLLHPLLDAITTGGFGVALFSPFNRRRYFFPWHPVLVSPMGVRAFLTRYGWRVLKSEMRWIWGPMAAIALLAWIIRGVG